MLGALSYAYNAAGERKQLEGTWARTGVPQAVATATYDANNQQLAFGSATMTFDLNGNLAALSDGDGTTIYAWNVRDQLTAISGPGVMATFGYDGLGRRRTKTINGAQTDFLHDRLNPVQEGVLPAVPTANLLTGLGIDEHLTRADAAGMRHILPDALGSALALADSIGAISTEYTYEPFGATLVTGASSTNAFQYTGRENDTGLYYYRARYYAPRLSRFIQEDPIEWAGGDTNLYAYVWNAPTLYTDPSGLASFPFRPGHGWSRWPKPNPNPRPIRPTRDQPPTPAGEPPPDPTIPDMSKWPWWKKCLYVACTGGKGKDTPSDPSIEDILNGGGGTISPPPPPPPTSGRKPEEQPPPCPGYDYMTQLCPRQQI
jgi:RHS repeat-associated protein